MFQKFLLSLIVSLLINTGIASATDANTQLVSPQVRAKVFNVAKCEESYQWTTSGSLYQGGLGWMHQTWLNWRAPWMPLWMNLATPQEQAWAMVRFIDRGPQLKFHGVLMPHGWWPDQLPGKDNCTGGY